MHLRHCFLHWVKPRNCLLSHHLSSNGYFLMPCAHGPERDRITSPRQFTGRPKGASRVVSDSLIRFLECYDIPLRAFTRHTRISGWAIRQAKDGLRNLPPRQELVIKLTIERIRTGKIWPRRVNPRRLDLEWINPPYQPRCPTGALYCTGGLLPASCPRHWNECIMNSKNWESVEGIHTAWKQNQKESGQIQAGE